MNIFLINLHSEACLELHRQIILENNKQNETWENYKNELYNFWDGTEDNRKILKIKFK